MDDLACDGTQNHGCNDVPSKVLLLLTHGYCKYTSGKGRKETGFGVSKVKKSL
jgi:hypothetical protein